MRSKLALFFITLVAAPQIAARDIHYGVVDHPGLLACDRQQWRGQLDDADLCYRRLLGGDVPFSVRAEAAWALGDLQLANQLFRDAAAIAPNDAVIRVRWGDLFADTHQDGEAMSLYREAMQLDENNGFAYVGAARVLAVGFDDEANDYLEPLMTNTSLAAGARLSAWLLVSRVSLESGNYSQAAEAMEQAEELMVAGDWPPLELYALRAAYDLLHNITDSPFTPMSLEYNPHFGGIYAIPAHFYVITRRYREAIDLYQKAVDVEPGLASAHEALGINLLRDNQFPRARRHLETAYEVDPFSPSSVNTLRLMDSFVNFDVINDPALPQRGVLPIILRLHKDESPAITPYAIKLTRDSIREFTERYGFELREPVVVEMYPDHEDFAVRTAGMPGLGILGATFGYVVAMDSPSSRPASQFQWGTTLWHELAHVFTLEATGHLVPRWFSEGVSVFEEWRSGPNPGVRIPMTVYNAMKEDKFLAVAELDEGFVRPTYEEQVIVSYMQAGLICHYIDQQFGAAKLRELLYAFGDGQMTVDAISMVFAMSPDDFDDDFNRYLQREHGTILDNFEDWHRTHQSLAKLAMDKDWAAIPELAAHLIDLLPGYVEPDSPYVVLARAHEALGEREAAIAALEAFWKNGGYDPAVLKRLSGWHEEAGQAAEAIDVLQTVNMIDPLDLEMHGTLGDLLMAENRPAEALLEYSVALSLDPHDKATAYYRLARAHHGLGDRAASQRQLLMALDVAPNFRPAQRLLLDLMRSESGIEQQ